MIEVAFDGPTAGNLRAAQVYCKAKELENSEILCIDLMMDIGDLNEGFDSAYRKELPDRLYSIGFYEFDPKYISGPLTGANAVKNILYLRNRIQEGCDIRIWFDDKPHSLCGFFHLCTFLKDAEVNIYTVKCPILTDKSERALGSWATLDYKYIIDYLPRAMRTSKKEIMVASKRWEELTEENAPIRVVLSGYPVSANENFYDFFIERNITNEPEAEEMVVFKALIDSNSVVYPFWFEKRIQAMIDDGTIIIDHDSEKHMKRIIHKL